MNIVQTRIGDVGVLVIACLLTAAVGAQIHSDETIRISGHVVGPDGPIRSEILTLETTDRSWVGTSQTDGNGAFSFLARRNRHYVLQLAIPGFVHWGFGIDANEKDVDVGNVGVQPPPPIRISGTLMDYMGNPLPYETIALEGRGQNRTMVSQSGADSAFSFDMVPPDRDYTLRVDPKGLMTTAIDLTVNEGNIAIGTLIVQPRAKEDATFATASSQRNARVSGSIVDERGRPQYQVLTFQNVATSPAASASTLSTLRVTAGGNFVFPAEAGATYEIYPAFQPASGEGWIGLGKLVIADNLDVNLGTIIVTSVSPKKIAEKLTGTARVTLFRHTGDSRSTRRDGNHPPSVAAVFLGNGSSGVVVLSNGDEARIPAQKGQVGASLPLISPDKQAAGWLIDSPFCCTSYPIDLALMVYRPNMPVQYFTGDGRAIFRWHFVQGSKSVAFYQDFLHGTPAQHYELRDVNTGRLIDKWDSELTFDAPFWTQGLR